MTVDRLLARAAALSWPTLTLKPGMTLVSTGEASYRRFVDGMTALQHRLLDEALTKAEHASPRAKHDPDCGFYVPSPAIGKHWGEWKAGRCTCGLDSA